MDLTRELNDSQRLAVEYCDGPSLVIAGAGSGKTRVLTYKIAYLISKGLHPNDILALTFTNKAAREMCQRVGRLVGTDVTLRWMGTFHSVFAKILRIESKAIGYEQNFSIYDENDTKSLIKRILKELGYDETCYKPNNVASRISEAKNRLVTPQEYADSPYVRSRDEGMKMPELYRIYKVYCERCRQANAMDFDDLLFNTYFLFKNNEDIRRLWAEKFHYVLVDEYQDTNYAQHKIVMQFTAERQKVCVVGDDAQSIYSFRGANIDNILSFSKSYQGVRTFKLERNYRSTKRIVAAANSLIKHNEQQIEKNIYSENQEGECLIRKDTHSDREEALMVCKDIRRIIREEGMAYSDFAVLYRTNAQSRIFEESMRREGIPYRIYGGVSFYSRKEIKDIIAYFRLVSNPDDDEALRRIINYPARGIGEATKIKIQECSTRYQTSMWSVIGDPHSYGLDVNNGTLNKLNEFRLLILSFIEAEKGMNAYEIGVKIIEDSKIKNELYSIDSVEGDSARENLNEFIGSLNDFVDTRQEEDMEDSLSLNDFLQEVSLITDMDSKDKADMPRVCLMTVHSAKGLEFPTVFIVGMEENIFPSPKCVFSHKALEEERRLFYVAITRAEKHCIITTAHSRWQYGKMEINSPSRFLRDIDPRFISGGNERPRPTIIDSIRSRMSVQHSTPPAGRNGFIPVRNANANVSAAVPELREGMTVEHSRFGVGKVLHVEGTGDNTKATVEFENVGIKQLLLRFARIKVREV